MLNFVNEEIPLPHEDEELYPIEAPDALPDLDEDMDSHSGIVMETIDDRTTQPFVTPRPTPHGFDPVGESCERKTSPGFKAVK